MTEDTSTTTTNAATETPRVWVGCLACYNAGALIGEWIDGTEAESITPDYLHDSYGAGAGYEPHEELWCFDHEGYMGALSGECSPAEAQRIAEALEDVDDPEAFAAYLDDVGDLDDALESFEDAYAGKWASEEEYAAELADDIYGVSSLARRADERSVLARYFDYEAFARDLFMSDYRSTPASGGGVHVFRVI